MVNEMRAIPPPDNIGIANVDGGSLYDCRLPGNSTRFGPFRTVQDFHRYLRGGLDVHTGHLSEVNELIAQHEGEWPPPCFTHGDLSSLNILIRGDEVVGIIDWETAGWYPSYWEYTTAWNVNPQNEFWREEVDKFLEPRPEELAMEGLRMEYFGDI
jgi:aminoglycoside phosphotransferase (APT) family kinase protein